MSSKYKILLAVFIFCCSAKAQIKNTGFSFLVKENFTSSSRLYLSPKSPDIVERNSSYAIDNIFSPAFEIRYQISTQMFLGLNFEYVSKTRKGIYLDVLDNDRVESVELEEGYSVVPVEFSFLYQLPFSSDIFKVLMYGGMGCYIGNNIRKFGDVSISTAKRKFAYGIHVGVSFEYELNSFIAASGELKFRDPEVDITSAYDNRTVHYGDKTVLLGQDHFDSKINIDGITYSLGIKITI
jgi:hypothetical protein